MLATNTEATTLERRLDRTTSALAAAESEIERLKGLLRRQNAPALVVAHELRSPAASICNTLSVLLQGHAAANSALQDEMLRLARDRAQAMLELVNDFLNLGNIQHAEIERSASAVEADGAVYQVVPEMRIKAMLRGVKLEIEVARSLPPVMASAEHLERLFHNLIDNAIKYTPNGGTVTVRLYEADDRLVGEVEDTGIGIAEKDLPRIFEQFFRSDAAKALEPYGTGLGMTIVQRILKLYGGDLRIESEPGQGTTMTFSFQAARTCAQLRPQVQATVGPAP